ncbi:MAG: hypothetical protein NW223_23890 [Hyphomicrobiaceae bacterium]|nr:hypothetical protein [Hyphomicrobiaceae bacterium]
MIAEAPPNWMMRAWEQSVPFTSVSLEEAAVFRKVFIEVLRRLFPPPTPGISEIRSIAAVADKLATALRELQEKYPEWSEHALSRWMGVSVTNDDIQELRRDGCWSPSSPGEAPPPPGHPALHGRTAARLQPLLPRESWEYVTTTGAHWKRDVRFKSAALRKLEQEWAGPRYTSERMLPDLLLLALRLRRAGGFLEKQLKQASPRRSPGRPKEDGRRRYIIEELWRFWRATPLGNLASPPDMPEPFRALVKAINDNVPLDPPLFRSARAAQDFFKAEGAALWQIEPWNWLTDG